MPADIDANAWRTSFPRTLHCHLPTKSFPVIAHRFKSLPRSESPQELPLDTTEMAAKACGPPRTLDEVGHRNCALVRRSLPTRLETFSPERAKRRTPFGDAAERLELSYLIYYNAC